MAKRAALLAGRDDEFTMMVTIGYTGMRWGETIGLERDLLLPALINAEWQLREISGRFHRLLPKDDSYRSCCSAGCGSRKAGNRLIEVIGGRSVHPINVRVGGPGSGGGADVIEVPGTGYVVADPAAGSVARFQPGTSVFSIGIRVPSRCGAGSGMLTSRIPFR